MLNLTYLLYYFIVLSFIPANGIDSRPIIESHHENQISFDFKLIDNSIKIAGSFDVDGNIDCVKPTSFNFDHKKNYTKNPTDLVLIEQGKNWYTVDFVIEKYFMAKVHALYKYSLDEERNTIRFKLLSNNVNIRTLDVVESSEGTIRFIPKGNKIKVQYNLNYEVKPTMFKKKLYKIQKNESIQYLSDFKRYLETHCE